MSKEALTKQFKEAGIEDSDINIVETDQGFSVMLAGDEDDQFLIGLVPFDEMAHAPFVKAMTTAWEEGAPDEHEEDCESVDE